MGILRDRDLADDATQQTFVRAFEQLARFRGAASFRTWLCAIATNECRNLARRDRAGRAIDLDDAPESALAAPDPSTDPVQDQRLATFVDKLPARQRAVVSLRVYADLP